MSGKSFQNSDFSGAVLTDVLIDEDTNLSGADLSFATYDPKEIMKAKIDHTTKLTDSSGNHYTVIIL